jgi:MFS family permease
MLVSATGFVLMAVGAHFTIIIGALLAGGLGWGWVAPMNLAVIQRHRHAPAAAMGTQMTGFFSGALIGPLLVGILIGTGGFTEAWVLCTVFAVLAAAAALAARRMSLEPRPA